MITVTGGQAVTLRPPVDKNGLTGGQKGGVPVDNTCPPITKQVEQVEESLSVPKKRKAEEYTSEFETSVWMPYPRRTNTSKLNAFKKWLALTPEQQALVISTIPHFAAAKRASGTEEKFIPHLEFYISRRIFETVGIGSNMGDPSAVPQLDRQTWENLAKIYDAQNNWRRDWGPEPGSPGCRMPADLQAKFVGAMH